MCSDKDILDFVNDTYKVFHSRHSQSLLRLLEGASFQVSSFLRADAARSKMFYLSDVLTHELKMSIAPPAAPRVLLVLPIIFFLGMSLPLSYSLKK